MGKKIRVYELAQKMGLENKALLDKLHAAGIEAKSHMSILDETDLGNFGKDSDTPEESVEEKIEEQRITPGIIRRRRKEVSKPAPAQADSESPGPAGKPESPAAEPEKAPAHVAEKEPAETSASSVETKTTEAESSKPTSTEAGAAEEVAAAKEADRPEPEVTETAKTKEEHPIPAPPETETREAETRQEPALSESEPAVREETVTAPSQPSGQEARPKAPEKMEQKPAQAPGKAVPAKQPPKDVKATPTKAKILGRVELPHMKQQSKPAPSQPARQAKPAPSSDQERPEPRRKPSVPQAPMAPPDELFPGKEPGRAAKKGKKGKGSFDRGKDLLEEGKGRRPRREIFEPDRERPLRKNRKAIKPNQKTEVTVSKAIKRIIRISDVITVGELAKRMGVKGKDLIKELMRQGTMVTINHPLDFETAALLASEFHYEVENVAFDEEVILEDTGGLKAGEPEVVGELQIRPPVVTIMGHVDHGKTSLLDAIRTTNVTAGEAGGITQHIGAYDVEMDGRKITFLDTPGHEAFTAMRARGAQVTDIVVLVVAADDGVMPQTREAINHSKAAGVPIIVAINKIDKPDANPDRVKQELTEFQLVPEDWGGETIFVEVSAKQQTNLDELLEMILLQAEVLELKSNPAKRAKGVIVEARLDKGRGPVATVLVQEGTLRTGDPVVTGIYHGRVRTMTNDRGILVEEAGPSSPVEVTGLSGTPEAGDTFHAVESEKAAKDVASHRQRKLREAELASSSKISLEQLYARLQEGEVKELKVILKADVQGSVEAVKDSLGKLSTEACRLVVIHGAVGGITESDVSLASASDAIILGFNVRPESKASAQAEAEGVDIRLYNIIYDAVADVRNAMEGLLAPTYREKHLGRVEVRETFHVSRVGTIAGCYVTEGKVIRGSQVRLVRDNIVVWEGKMSSLKRFKDDVREVASGYECGISLENFNDIKIGDIIEAFEMEAVKSTL
ncbi:MAG: translation initiation factor IF-2 [Syntrophotaleaceae bacterium]